MSKIKLRCLAVREKSHYFVGDICEVIAFSTEDGKTGTITIIGPDGKKVVDRFKFTKDRKLIAGDCMFQLLMIPVVKSA